MSAIRARQSFGEALRLLRELVGNGLPFVAALPLDREHGLKGRELRDDMVMVGGLLGHLGERLFEPLDMPVKDRDGEDIGPISGPIDRGTS